MTQRRPAPEVEFEDFARAAMPYLGQTAWLLCRNRHRCEDLVQETLTRTYVAWRRVRRDDALGYARRVLVNLHVDTWRRGRWEESTPDHHETSGGTYATDHPGAVGVVQRDQIQRLLAALSPRERAIVVMRYYLDLSEKQVADELKVSLGTVKSTASRAVARLRDEQGAQR